MNILDNTILELRRTLLELGEKPFRADQIFEWIYARNIYDFSKMTNLPQSIREVLEDNFKILPFDVESINESSDGSLKLLLARDQTFVEAVALPSDNDRLTFCLSTQAGCAIGCRFCATGKIGFIRNLSAGEIIAQVLLLQANTRRPDNIVLMGMGEALKNFEEVDRFVRTISEKKGYAMSPRRITISTAGLLDELSKFHKMHNNVEIAISLNASDNETRREIMPNRKIASFDEIIRFVKDFRDEITLEYVLLKDVNDSLSDARSLAISLTGSNNVKINLIRYNEAVEEYKAPAMKSVLRFQRILKESGLRCYIRKSLGRDIKAACGQLAGGKSIDLKKRK